MIFHELHFLCSDVAAKLARRLTKEARKPRLTPFTPARIPQSLEA
jgi:hypothetical protein